MKKKLYRRNSIVAVGCMLGLAALSACTVEVPAPPRARVVIEAPPVVVVAPPRVVVAPATVVVVRDDFVYYPQYEVYYSSSRQLYFYLDGGAWVSRPTPPRVEVRVLLATPSVQMEFHDAPEAHHASVAKTYPKDWSPPGRGRGRGKNGD